METVSQLSRLDLGKGTVDACANEIAAGRRFAFGKNWQRFVRGLTDEQIHRAEESITSMLDATDLHGHRFLDAGSGSGLSSLAARRLGARVHSLDFDAQSVACARELKKRHFQEDDCWTIDSASVLDSAYLLTLGEFDIVYCWGVLHHTGAMWQGLENLTHVVAKNGELFVALYNDQGIKSKIWRIVKRSYCSGRAGRIFVCSIFIPYFVLGHLFRGLLRGQYPWRRYPADTQVRGMSYFSDLLDWLGGYPFEVTSPDAVVRFCQARGFELKKIVTCGNGSGNNQFLFIRR